MDLLLSHAPCSRTCSILGNKKRFATAARSSCNRHAVASLPPALLLDPGRAGAKPSLYRPGPRQNVHREPPLRRPFSPTDPRRPPAPPGPRTAPSGRAGPGRASTGEAWPGETPPLSSAHWWRRRGDRPGAGPGRAGRRQSRVGAVAAVAAAAGGRDGESGRDGQQRHGRELRRGRGRGRHLRWVRWGGAARERPPAFARGISPGTVPDGARRAAGTAPVLGAGVLPAGQRGAWERRGRGWLGPAAGLKAWAVVNGSVRSAGASDAPGRGKKKKKGKMIRVDVLGRICCFLPWFVLRARQKRVCRKTDFYRVHRCRRMQGERLGLSHPGKDGVWKLRVFRVLLQCWQLYSFDKYCRKTGGNICKNRLGFVTRSAVLQTAKFHSCDGLFTLY